MARIPSALLIALILAACQGAGNGNSINPTPSPTTPLASGQTLGRPGCQPPSPAGLWQAGWPEVRGTVQGGELWALFDGTQLPVTQGVQHKIIWRMTGTGSFALMATGHYGQKVKPDWGPEAHGGSNWNRPGDEWGSAFTFPSGACWDIHATRQGVSGDLYIVVG